jgi:hypothetical protein
LKTNSPIRQESCHDDEVHRRDQLREQYVLCRTHKEKRYIQELLIAWVKQMDGEFVEESPHDNKVLQVVTDYTKLLKKVAQALREARKGPQSRHGSRSVPPTKHRRTTLARSKGSSSKPTPEDIASSKLDSPMLLLSEMIAQNMRIPRKAAKAVYSTISSPSIELQPMEHTITDDWNFNEDDFFLIQSLPLGFDLIEEKVTTIPGDVSSEVCDHHMGDKLEMNLQKNSAPENDELWDTLLDMDLSGDELWRHAKDLEDTFEF